MLDSMKVGKKANPASRFTYNTANGRLQSSTDPRNHTTQYSYYSTGWQNTLTVAHSGAGVSYTYDLYGRVASQGGGGQTAYAYYDVLNRPTKQTGPTAGDSVIYALGPDSLRVTDSKTQVYRFRRNAFGMDTLQVDPRGSATRMVYDRAGNRTKVTNRQGNPITFTYDAVGRLLSRTADSKTTSYSYNWGSTLWMRVSNAESTDTLKYDAGGRLTTAITVRGSNKYVLQSTYNTYSQRTQLQMTAPWTYTLKYSYNVSAQMDTLTGFDNLKTKIAYNTDGQVSAITLPTSLVITKDYPSVHDESSITYSNSTVNAKLGMTFGYDSLLAINQRGQAVGDTVMTYERYADSGFLHYYKLNLKTQSCGSDPDRGEECDPASLLLMQVWGSYAYDKLGNSSTETVETGNRLRSYAGYTLNYNADGNLTSKTKTGYSQLYYWDALGQLDSVKTNGVKTTFGYDGFGRRVRKNSQRYILDGDNLFVEATTANALVAAYSYYGLDTPHSRRTSTGAIYYYAMDASGNATGLISGSNTVANQYRVDPFGNSEYTSETVPQPLRFAARELDTETGLYYFRARYYEPTYGRFISEDPIGLAGGTNPYVYAANDPLTFRDPFGLESGDGGDCVTNGSNIEKAPDKPCDIKKVHVWGTPSPPAPPTNPLLPFLPASPFPPSPFPGPPIDGGGGGGSSEPIIRPAPSRSIGHRPKGACFVAVGAVVVAGVEDAASLMGGYAFLRGGRLTVNAARAAATQAMGGRLGLNGRGTWGVARFTGVQIWATGMSHAVAGATGQGYSIGRQIAGYIPIVNTGFAIWDAYEVCHD